MEDLKEKVPKNAAGGDVTPCDSTNMLSERAAEHFREGYNCAQSVMLAFLDYAEAVQRGPETQQTTMFQKMPDRKTALMLASSFGGGMGRLREVCGAVSALFMMAGLLRGYSSPNDDTAKAEHYALIQKLAEEFKKRHGTIICRELLGLNEEKFSPNPSKRTKEYYASRPCEAFIRTAAEIAVKFLL